MKKSPTRLGPWFALALLLPCAFAGVWLWLVPGGVVDRAREQERGTAEQMLQAAARRFRELVQATGAVEGLLVELDEQRRVVAPFVAHEPPAVDRAPSIAEQAALARLARGERVEALQFFAHAAERGELTPEGALAHAEAQAALDLPAARVVLSDARSHFREASCGNLPFALAALLVEARWADAGRDVDAVREQFCSLVVHATPDVAVAALADLEASGIGLDRQRAEALRAAASVRRAFAGEPLPDAAWLRCADGTVLVVGTFGRSASAVTAARAARIRAHEFGLQHTFEPDFELVVGPADDGMPELRLDGLGETWCARRAAGALPTSTLLATVANSSLVLALVTLVLGNLVLWRINRRESQLVRLRADFVDVVSHELRTPLTALSLKAEMLATGDVPEARRQHYLSTLHHDVLRLNDQVERILDFGRLQNGASLRREPVPGRSLLAKGLREGRAALRLVDQRVEVDAPRRLPPVTGDVDVLARALRNLLENAAKYAPRGSTVAVRAYASGRELVVEVADRGPGVPAGEHTDIFQPFVRGSDASSATPGSGLGLALVAAAAEKHGGRIEISQRPGGGAVFTLSLPADGERTARGEPA